MKSKRKKAPKRSRKNLNENLAYLAAMQEVVDHQRGLILALKRRRPISVLDDDEEDCPPLPDPNAPVNVYICQIFARVDYLLGLITCAEYQTQYAACTPGS